MGSNEFEAQDGTDQQKDEEYPPEVCRFVKQENADNNGAHGANAGPYRITGAHWNGLDGFVQQQEAECDAGKETDAVF